MYPHNRVEKPELCLLCEKEHPIDNSHIIPRSIKAILASDSEQKLRYSGNPNKPEQDIIKAPILCSKCENSLIKQFEDYFLNTIFKPFQEVIKNGLNEATNITPRKIEYNEKFKKFLISVSWRYLKYKLTYEPELINEISKKLNISPKTFDDVDNSWKRYLIGECPTTKHFEQYFFNSFCLPTDIEISIFETLENRAAFSQAMMMNFSVLYYKNESSILCTLIQTGSSFWISPIADLSKNSEHLKEEIRPYLIEDIGNIETPLSNLLYPESILNLLIGNLAHINKLSRGISEKQQEKISEKLLKHKNEKPDSFTSSLLK